MPGAPADTLAHLADDLKQRWRAGAAPGAGEAARQHPDLVRDRSVFVDLAYEEYCLREEAGAAPDVESFCRALPAHRSHVREVLRGHRLIADHPELFRAAEAAWPAVGDQLAGLTVMCELGRGAFARVYLARDPEMGGRPMVLKLAPAPSGEGRALGPVRHPHVVGVHWARPADPLFALCLPFVGAATWRDVLDAAFDPAAGRRSAGTVLAAIDRAAAALPDAPDPVPALLDGRGPYPAAVGRIFARLAGALAHLHGMGIAHGDLKPSNVLLGPGGHPYLIDFNLAGGPTESLLRCGGTLPYMAPERIRVLLGESAALGSGDRADVYSFGVMLFEALTGKLPFEPPANADLRVVAADLLRRQSAGPPRMPRPFARLIGRCLAADPARRPSAAEVGRALDGYVRRRGRRLLAGIALTGLAVAGLIGGQLIGRPWMKVGWPANPPEGLRSPPATPEEYFARGIEELRKGDGRGARGYFDRARELRPDPRTKAYLAYCMAEQNDHVGAAAAYEAAIQGGYREAWVHNNRAYSLLKIGGKLSVDRAVAEANAAVQVDFSLRAARLNRAFGRFRQSLYHPAPPFDPAEPLTDIEIVLKNGPYSAELYYKAALILVTLGPVDESRAKSAVECLRRALLLGGGPTGFERDQVFVRHLGQRPDYQELLKLPKSDAPSTVPKTHVADPPLF